MEEDVKIVNLKEVPNEFIVAAYNMSTEGNPIEAADFDMEKREFDDEMKKFLSPTDSTKDSDLMQFLTVINPKAEAIFKEMEQSCLKNYQETIVALAQNTKTNDILSESYENKVEALKKQTKHWIKYINELKKISVRFKYLVGMLHSTYDGNFKEFDVVKLRHPNKTSETIILYPNYVLGFDKTHGIQYDFYTKNEETTLNHYINEMYKQNETPAEKE